MSSRNTCVAYTTALLVMGLLLVSSVPISEFLIGRQPDDSDMIGVFRMVQFLNGILGVACFATAAFRAYRWRASRAATTAVTIVLMFFFPFGTLVGLYWFLYARKRECVQG